MGIDFASLFCYGGMVSSDVNRSQSPWWNMADRKGFIEFMTEVPKNKKLVGGKRQVDAVTGPTHKVTKPVRLEPTFAKVVKGISTLRRKTEMAAHPVKPIIKKRKTVKRTPIIRKK